MKQASLDDPTLSMINLTNLDLPSEIYKACDSHTIFSYSPRSINDLKHRVSPDLLISSLEAQQLLVNVRYQQEVLKKIEQRLNEQLSNFNR